ncbi:hypothetical protein D3C86_678370 [compost metagenome]
MVDGQIEQGLIDPPTRTREADRAGVADGTDVKCAARCGEARHLERRACGRRQASVAGLQLREAPRA